MSDISNSHSEPSNTVASPSPGELEVVRKAGPFETLTYEFHELGIQTNILVAARFRHSSATLTSEKLRSALIEVLKHHPALSIIGVSLPSEKKTGHHRLWEARLPQINFAQCVQFVSTNTGSDSEIARILESAHNEPFDTLDKTKPWWKLVVINESLVVFIFHHSIGDGISGYAFHRSLCSALNRNESYSGSDTDTEPSHSSMRSPKLPLVPCPLYQIQDKLSWPCVIYDFLFWTILRFLVKPKYFLFSDAVYSKDYPTVAKSPLMVSRTVTKVQVLRIPKVIMQKCLESCHKERSSFTALLHTLIQITLASDIYPKAVLGFSRLAVNIRSLLTPKQGPDDFTNAASNYCRVQFLKQYREAGSSTSITNSVHQDLFCVNKDSAWKLATAYKSALDKFIWGTRHVLQDFLAGELLGEDEEEVGTFYGMGLYHNSNFLISNIGVFHPKDDMVNGGWSVDEVMFSAGAVRAAVGDVGVVFSVASAKDGDCIICATYEKSVLKDEMVEKALEGILARFTKMV